MSIEGIISAHNIFYFNCYQLNDIKINGLSLMLGKIIDICFVFKNYIYSFYSIKCTIIDEVLNDEVTDPCQY